MRFPKRTPEKHWSEPCFINGIPSQLSKASALTSDSLSAWNYVGRKHQRCLLHYLRMIADTLLYKSPGIEFLPFARKLKRILKDAIRIGKTVSSKGDRLKAKKRFERRIDQLFASHESVDEKNVRRFIKRLRRERGMLEASSSEQNRGLASVLKLYLNIH